MPLEPLERKNVEHVIGEYDRDRQVLERYRDKGLLFIEEALTHIADEVLKLEDELNQG